MKETVVNRIRQLIAACYDRGVISVDTLTAMIAECAVNPEFFRYLDIIPTDVIQRLRKIAEQAEAHPEDYLIIQSISNGPGFDFEVFDRAQREAAYWSARRLREYFYPDQPMPEFEPLKFAGVVDDAIELNGSVVIFGDIQTYFMRKNPVHLIAPNGCKIITSATSTGFIKHERDLESSDPITRRLGRYGISLDQRVKSPSDVSPKTEVWVDRTAVAELPDPPIK